MPSITFAKKPNARTGNILFQYLFAKTLAIRFHYTYIPYESFDFSSPYVTLTDETADAFLSATPSSDEHILCDGFFQQSKYYVPFRAQLLDALRQDPDDTWTSCTGASESIRPFLFTPSSVSFEPNDLVLSLRLDDFIQYPRETSDILPPPFYMDILERIPNKGRVIIVCDTFRHDWEHKYAAFFAKWSPIWVQGNLLSDFATLRDAPALLHSNSSFCWIASFLSAYTKPRWIPKTGFYASQNLDRIESSDRVASVTPLLHEQVHRLDYSTHLLQSEMYPLAYSIPDERIVDSVPPKTEIVASLVPGDSSTYRFGPNQEQEYHQMYRDARFAHTRKKGGWDCLRHYEILANGCIPLFENLDQCPPTILSTFPKRLVKEASRTLLPWTPDKEPLYQEYVSQLLDHCRKWCSSSAAASYVMEKMHRPGYNVLLIRGHAGVNYTRELTWTGIVRMCREKGGIATEYPPMDFMYDSYAGNADTLYGHGYTYSRTLDSHIVMSEAEVVEKLQQRFWNCIIYGKVGPDELWEGSMPNLPLWNHVFQWYGKHEIAFFYGGDETVDVTYANRYREHLLQHAPYATCFVRELMTTRVDANAETNAETVCDPIVVSPFGKHGSLADYIKHRCAFYCVSYNSQERAKTMTGRFAQLGLDLHIHGGVQMEDPRLQFSEVIADKRLASVFYGHLDNIRAFYDTGKPYGFFCEDDVHIHRDLATELPILLGEFNAMSLDILLLGYMTTVPIEWWTAGYPLVYDGGESVSYRYHRYPQNQWGVHLFMISRSYAKTLLDVFDATYAGRAHADPSLVTYNPDWTLSKHTEKRALRYPMLAVEDGKGKYEHWGQGEFHRNSHLANYREGEFL